MPETDFALEKLLYSLHQIGGTSSLSTKKELLTKFGNELPEFKEMLVYALDPYKKYGIQHLPASPVFAESATWAVVKQFLDKASAGQLKGAELIAGYNEVAGRMSFNNRTLFTRIVLKDLRCGMGATLVNEVFPKLIPQFGVMLAETLAERHVKAMKQFSDLKHRKTFVQPKKNGDRVLIFCVKGKPTEVLSREGHALYNYNQVASNLKHLTESSPYDSLVFDGEVIVGDFFKTRAVKRKSGNEAVGAVFHLFDTIHHEEWMEQETSVFSERNALSCELMQLSSWKLSENLKKVKTWVLKPEQITWEFIIRIRDWFMCEGEEGVILRPDLPYNFKTRSSLFKLKKMETMDCLIEEVLPGEEGKKHAHHAGAVLVRLDDGDTLCKAGLKLSDVERDEMWKNKAYYEGRYAEVSYQSKTVNQQGTPKLQFPVFVRVRGDKS